MIVIVFGLPGSGKSYFAERLAKMMQAEYVSSDRLRMEIFKNRTYSKEEKAAVYHLMLEKMKVAASRNKHIVLDATFHSDETRKPFIQEAGKELFLIKVEAAEILIRQRLMKERADSEADFRIYKLIQQEWEQLNQPHLLLESTDENIDNMLQKAVEYLHWKDDKRTDQ